MAKHQVCAVLVKEPEVDAYLLPDAFPDNHQAWQAMQFRAEELVDELTSQAAEMGDEVGNYVINPNPDEQTITIVKHDESDLNQMRELEVTTLSIHVITVDL